MKHPIDYAGLKYIRVWTQSPAELDFAGWEARSLFWHLQRLMYPTGVFRFGTVPVETLVSRKTGIPIEVIVPALQLLIELQIIALRDDTLVDPDFEASQFDPDNRRKPIPRAVRQQVLAEHGMFCWLCEHPISDTRDLHLGHVVPWSSGGRNDPQNLRPAHVRCNARRGNKPAEQFRLQLASEAEVC